MTWEIWIISPFTGDRKELVASYSNRGHAVARIKGLRRSAWAACSEMCYSMRRG